MIGYLTSQIRNRWPSVAKRLGETRSIVWGYLPVFLVTLLGVLITVLAYSEVVSWERQRIRDAFLEASRDRALVIQREIEHCLSTVHDIASLFDASVEVRRREFRRFVGPALRRHCGIKALEWIPRVEGADRESFVEQARKSFPPFQITEIDETGKIVKAGKRTEHYPVLYVQPYKLNKERLGSDMAADPQVLPLLLRAQEKGELQVSQRIPIVEDGVEKSGFVATVPLYFKEEAESQGESDWETEEKPDSQQVRGFAVGIFRVGEIIERALESLSPAGIDMYFHEDPGATDRSVIYSHGSRLGGGAAAAPTGEGKQTIWRSTQQLAVGDRLWGVVSTPVPGRFQPDSGSGWIVLVAGLAFTALLTAYVATLVGHAEKVKLLVDERTAQLRGAIKALNKEIVERKRAETQLQRLNETLELRVIARTAEAERRAKDLEQFAYVTSHDLKAPLRSIGNLAGWIEEDLQGRLNKETREQLNLLKDRVKRMHALIVGLLEYSRVGQTEGSQERVDTHELLEEIIDSLSPPKEFTIRIGEDMPVFHADRLQLGQVFSNLIGNSINHHQGSKGKVWVTAEDKGEFFEFCVADDGPGIAPEYHDKVFMMFQTLETTDYEGNTGIGLALVKKIVQEQGGTITLDSAEGKGTSFRFTWPRGTESL